MRRELIEALNFPRKLVKKTIEQRDCPHGNRFETTSEHCHQCDLGSDCQWVSCLNDFADFDGRATQTINVSLRYGIEMVGTLNSELRHDQESCQCEACTWIRDSQRLSKDFDNRFALNRFRHLY